MADVENKITKIALYSLKYAFNYSLLRVETAKFPVKAGFCYRYGMFSQILQ